MRTLTRWSGRAALAAAATLALTAAPARAQQSPQMWQFTLRGSTEATPNNSPATGSGMITLNGNLLRIQATFSGLTGPTTQAHIHCCTALPFTGAAGVATPLPSFPGFPLNVTAGAYDETFDLSLPGSYNPTFLNANGGTPTLAAQVLVTGMNQGRAYFNIHTTTFPGGEINGFTVAVIPEPGTYALLATGLAGVGFVARRRRQA
jgi:hypothetical protein